MILRRICGLPGDDTPSSGSLFTLPRALTVTSAGRELTLVTAEGSDFIDMETVSVTLEEVEEVEFAVVAGTFVILLHTMPARCFSE